MAGSTAAERRCGATRLMCPWQRLWQFAFSTQGAERVGKLCRHWWAPGVLWPQLDAAILLPWTLLHARCLPGFADSHLQKLAAEELLRVSAEVDEYQPLAEALGLQWECGTTRQAHLTCESQAGQERAQELCATTAGSA